MGWSKGLLSPGELEHVLAQYDLGPLLEVRQGGGTAAPKTIVRTDRGEYMVRRRRREFRRDNRCKTRSAA